MSTVAAYSEGSTAFVEAKTLEDNPYPAGSPSARAWAKGWMDAERWSFKESVGQPPPEE